MDGLKKQVAEMYLSELAKVKSESEMVRRSRIARWIAERDTIVGAILEARPDDSEKSDAFFLGCAMTLDLLGKEFGIVADPELSAWRGGGQVAE